MPSGASPEAVSRQPTPVQLGEEVAAMINCPLPAYLPRCSFRNSDYQETLASNRDRGPQVDNDRCAQAPAAGSLGRTAGGDQCPRRGPAHLRGSSEGGPVAVVIAGDAGIGKSRLAAEVSGRAAAAGWLLLSAGCVDLAEGSVPYLPLVDALRGFTAAELPPVLEHWRRGEPRPGGTRAITGHGSRSGLLGLPRPAACP